MMSAALPSTRDEDWRWADLRVAHALEAAAPPEVAPVPAAAAAAFPWLAIEATRHLFVAGRAAAGTEAAHPDALSEAPPHALADRAATAAGPLFEIADGTDGGIAEIGFLATAGASASHSRVRLGRGARLILIETFADQGLLHWANHRFDAEVAEGAELVRLVRAGNQTGLVSERCFTRVAAGGLFRQVVLGTGAAALRSEAEVWLEGAAAHADIDGALLGSGAAALDALTRVRHLAAGATSGQNWRLVASGEARVSVSGGIEVARHAQKTQAAQSLKALLLTRAAAANMKPELRILADDVQCAHGCTVGALDHAALFYLEARGIPPAAARTLLTGAFIADAMRALDRTPLAAAVGAACDDWLARAETQG
jgi:Fe-S cluster assembly protein SufD